MRRERTPTLYVAAWLASYARERTGRVLIVHEAGLTGGFGAELAARVADSAFAYLDAPIRRLAFPDHPVPFHKTLEDGCLPSTETIATALVDLVGW